MLNGSAVSDRMPTPDPIASKLTLSENCGAFAAEVVKGVFTIEVIP
jgi:hypothetical protein